MNSGLFPLLSVGVLNEASSAPNDIDTSWGTQVHILLTWLKLIKSWEFRLGRFSPPPEPGGLTGPLHFLL